MKTAADLIEIAGTRANILIDASKGSTANIIRIVGSIGFKDSHITIKNASKNQHLTLFKLRLSISKL